MRKQMRTVLVVLMLSACVGVATRADNKTGALRAEELLKQARAAIGGAEKVSAVRSLTVKGKFRRVVQERDISGEREFNFLLPDKFMQTDSIFIGAMGTSMTNYRVLNGSDFWAGNSSGGPNVMIMGMGGQKLTKEQLEQMEKRRAQNMRAEYTRYVMALLLSSPAGFDLQFSYAGEAVADDGRADVIDATGADGFAARIFLDKESHLPLMLSYRAQRMRTITIMGGRPPDGKTKEDLIKEAREKADKEIHSDKPEDSDMQIRFSDYRKVNGLLLPHKITQATDGEIDEEWEIKSFEINPQFKADKFQKK